MNQEFEKFESLLQSDLPKVPTTLRNSVDQVVRDSLKRQTRRDDMKWLGFCSCILMIVIVAQWSVFKIADQSSQKISNLIASSATGKQISEIYSGEFPVRSEFTPNR